MSTPNRKKLNNKLYVDAWLQRHSNPSGVIFAIVNNINNHVFILTTRSPVKKRWWQVIAAANQGKKGALYEEVREYGKDNFSVEIIHTCYPNEDLESRKREAVLLFENTGT